MTYDVNISCLICDVTISCDITPQSFAWYFTSCVCVGSLFWSVFCGSCRQCFVQWERPDNTFNGSTSRTTFISASLNWNNGISIYSVSFFVLFCLDAQWNEWSETQCGLSIWHALPSCITLCNVMLWTIYIYIYIYMYIYVCIYIYIYIYIY